MSDTITSEGVDQRMPTSSIQAKEPAYVGTKIITAIPMSYEQWARSQNKWQEGQETMGEGYRVTYEDGYKSWSPKAVFERCYREITYQERRMV